jgi:acyl dehydratase
MADKTKIGKVFPPYVFEVEKGKIAEFAMAVSQAENKNKVKPIYVDANAAKAAGYGDIVPPPTFQTSFLMWAGSGLLSLLQELDINLGRLLHGEEEYEYFTAIHPGDVLTSTTMVADMYDKEKKDKPGKFMEFTVLETEIKNQRGELVIRSRTTAVER